MSWPPRDSIRRRMRSRSSPWASGGNCLHAGLGGQVGHVVSGVHTALERVAPRGRLVEQPAASHRLDKVLDEVRVHHSRIETLGADGYPVVLHVPPEPAGPVRHHHGRRHDHERTGRLQECGRLGEADVGVDPVERVAGEHHVETALTRIPSLERHRSHRDSGKVGKVRGGPSSKPVIDLQGHDLEPTFGERSSGLPGAGPDLDNRRSGRQVRQSHELVEHGGGSNWSRPVVRIRVLAESRPELVSLTDLPGLPDHHFINTPGGQGPDSAGGHDDHGHGRLDGAATFTDHGQPEQPSWRSAGGRRDDMTGTVLIAGASGLVGTAATESFLAAGYDVIALSRRRPEVATPVPVPAPRPRPARRARVSRRDRRAGRRHARRLRRRVRDAGARAGLARPDSDGH